MSSTLDLKQLALELRSAYANRTIISSPSTTRRRIRDERCLRHNPALVHSGEEWKATVEGMDLQGLTLRVTE
jgi:hypothetical protein